MAQQKKDPDHSTQAQEKTTTSRYNYDKLLQWLEDTGKKQNGPSYDLVAADLSLIRKLIAYFMKDETTAALNGLNLDKGILLAGPIGCGKTSLLALLRLLQPAESRFIMRSCRDISFEFIERGYSTIPK